MKNKRYIVRFQGLAGFLVAFANRRTEAVRMARKQARSIIGRKEYFDVECVEVERV